jgi:hypothetical protein
MAHELPPIIRLAERFQLDVELAVLDFAQRHKWQLGADLRTQATTIIRLANRAWDDSSGRAEWIGKLKWAISDVKISLQLGQRLKVFKSFGQFEALIRLAEDLGRQTGGWQRKHPQGQNAVPTPVPRRAQTLSTQATSPGVNP